MRLSKQQQEIVKTRKFRTVVISCAASGKTAVITERIKYLLTTSMKDKNIVAITFTNLAAEEMRTRIGDVPENVFIGTIHSYGAKLMNQAGIYVEPYVSNEEFDEMLEKAKEENVKKYFPTVDYLIVDEAQDCDRIQFEFLLETLNPEKFMLVGDFRQSIYQYDGADPEYLIDISKRNDVQTYKLTTNYRNGSDILTVAKAIIAQNGYTFADDSTAKQSFRGRVITCDLSYPAIIRTLQKYGNYNEWAILCRTNYDVDCVSSELAKGGIPYSVIRKRDFDNLEDFQKEISADTVKVMTIHSSKGCEFKNVIVIGARMKVTNDEAECCLSYVAATRAIETLVWAKKVRGKKDATPLGRISEDKESVEQKLNWE